jgi:hypothetical protein
MKRLSALWHAACSGNPLIGIRGLAVMAFLAVAGAFVGGEFHRSSLADFCGGMALSFTGILVFQVFALESASTKRDPDESRLTELHLSR